MAPSKASLPSDDTIPSTPLASDAPIFSDDATNGASSPPSSPPGFPWEQENKPQPTTSFKPFDGPFNAFTYIDRRKNRNPWNIPDHDRPSTVLGKRKLFQEISNNAPPTKKALNAPLRPGYRTLTQMQISVGQQVQKKCKECGMEYIASSAEDRKLHDKYHKQNLHGFDVGKDFLRKGRDGTTFDAPIDGDVVSVVDGFDCQLRNNRARDALKVVQMELGAVEIPEKELWATRADHFKQDQMRFRYATYMYIRGTKCIGVLLAEWITTARAVVQPAAVRANAKRPPVPQEKKSALASLRAKHDSTRTTDQTAQPIELTTKSSPATLGISRIWTSPTHRGQGIATALLDMALTHHPHPFPEHTDLVVQKERVAFSQPTDAGARLARRWFGKKYGWLVYVD